MKKATVRDLRNSFPRIAAWVEDGESVEITRGGKLFAKLVPARPELPRKFKMPDFKARLKDAFGEKVYDSDDIARGIAQGRGKS